MRIAHLAAVAGLCGLALAQQPSGPRRSGPAPVKTFVSAADVQTLMATAIRNRTTQPVVLESLLSLAPYAMNLEYRPAPGTNPAAVHPTDAEVFFILDGTATLITGGTIADGKITGGTPQKLAKGDFAVVPENTPHWFTEVSEHFFDASIKVPRTAEK